jgi:two-component system, NarL family, nitrate/nitrite response regulator NarL
VDPEAIRVVLVEDHQMVAEALAAALQAHADIDVVAVAGSIRQCLAAVAAQQPDVVLLDYQLPDGNGVQAIPRVRESAPGAAVLLITGEAPEAVAAEAIAAGCAGLVPKGQPISEVVAAIRAVHRGDSAFEAGLLLEVLKTRADQRDDITQLTPRELEVLRLLDTGAATDAIAEQLFLSLHTVRNHIRHITEKLGAHSRLEALAIARRRGLLGPRPARS